MIGATEIRTSTVRNSAEILGVRSLLNKNMLCTWVALLLAVSVPARAGDQHHNAPAPAPKASAPAPRSAPSQSHGSTPSRGATGSRTATTGGHTTTANRPGTTAGHTTTANRPGTTAGHTSTANHPATANHAAPTNRLGTANARTGSAPGRSTAANRPTASRTPPGRTVSLKGGGTASVRPNGQIRSIDRGGMHIEHGVRGGRTVVAERNGARIVARGRGGYVQRAYVTRGGRSYYSRTYVSGGVVRVGVYRGYYFGGRPYYGYYPGVWYNPGFYAWGYQPWGAPVYWGVGAWGWGGSPWWGFYGGWFTPYPYYASPAFWLTDYLISQQLQAAYAARQEDRAAEMSADGQASAGGGDSGGGDAGGGQPQASGGVALTPEVKEAIAAEVKAQLAAQQNQAPAAGASNNAATPPPTDASNQAPPPALDPAQRTFVVDSDVTVVANGQECALTGGDVITRLTDTPDPSDQTVSASISAAKKGDCAAGQTVAVKVDDLQEMYNHFAENLNTGLTELAKKQGTGGMPKAPDTATVASDVPPPPPDKTAAKAVQDTQQQADQTEAQVKQETAGSTGGTQ